MKNVPVLVTPVANLALILMTICFLLGSTSMGFRMALPHREPEPPGQFLETRIVVVNMDAAGTLRINSEPVNTSTLTTRLREIFRTRVQKLAFVYGDPSVEFGQVARLIDLVREAVPNVALLTDSSTPTLKEPILRF